MSDFTKWTGRFTNFPGPSLLTFLAMIYQISCQFTNFPATFPRHQKTTVFLLFGGGVGGHAGTSCQSAASLPQPAPASRQPGAGPLASQWPAREHPSVQPALTMSAGRPSWLSGGHRMGMRLPSEINCRFPEGIARARDRPWIYLLRAAPHAYLTLG